MSSVNHGDRRFKDKSDFDSISIFNTANTRLTFA